jgi:hypothetical protein
MTTTEPATRKPTAKELAEDALEQLSQLRTELTELRDRLSDGVPSGDGGPQLAVINKEFNEFVEFVNKQFATLVSTPVAVDTEPLMEKVRSDLAELERATADHFTSFSRIVDTQNTAATKAIEELREQMPSVATLVSTVSELADKVRLFDEAGVAPASGEDIDQLDARLKAIEEIATGNKLPASVTVLTEDGVTAATGDDLNLVHQRVNELERDLSKMRGYLESPTFVAIERTADVMAEARNGLVLAAAPRSGVPAIYGQVHQLMKLVTELGKDKEADKKMGGYKFRSVDAAMDVVGHALREVGVMFQPREILHQRIERYETVSKDGYRQNWTHVWVTQRYAFVSLIDGSEMNAIEMDGEARDNGDKSTSKADSMRLKYALLQALMIPINGLPESDGRDGTEGGQVYGRGDAGESWENASPVRPGGDRTEQHVDTRPHETTEEVQNSETAYGYGHQPAESPGGQAHAQAQQAQREDDRTPEQKAQAAYDALVALAGLERPAQRPRLNRILTGITTEGLGGYLVTGVDGQAVKLAQYAATVNSQVGA